MLSLAFRWWGCFTPAALKHLPRTEENFLTLRCPMWWNGGGFWCKLELLVTPKIVNRQSKQMSKKQQVKKKRLPFSSSSAKMRKDDQNDSTVQGCSWTRAYALRAYLQIDLGFEESEAGTVVPVRIDVCQHHGKECGCLPVPGQLPTSWLAELRRHSKKHNRSQSRVRQYFCDAAKKFADSGFWFNWLRNCTLAGFHQGWDFVRAQRSPWLALEFSRETEIFQTPIGQGNAAALPQSGAETGSSLLTAAISSAHHSRKWRVSSSKSDAEEPA